LSSSGRCPLLYSTDCALHNTTQHWLSPFFVFVFVVVFCFCFCAIGRSVAWCSFGRDVLEGLAEAVVAYCQHLPPDETTVYLSTPGYSHGHSKVKVKVRTENNTEWSISRNGATRFDLPSTAPLSTLVPSRKARDSIYIHTNTFRLRFLPILPRLPHPPSNPGCGHAPNPNPNPNPYVSFRRSYLHLICY